MARRKNSGPTVTGDAAQAWNLVLLARAAGMVVDHVSVGTCTMNLRPVPSASRRDDAPEVPPSAMIYDEFGREVLRQLMGDKRGGPAVPGADLQPSIEVES